MKEFCRSRQSLKANVVLLFLASTLMALSLAIGEPELVKVVGVVYALVIIGLVGYILNRNMFSKIDGDENPVE